MPFSSSEAIKLFLDKVGDPSATLALTFIAVLYAPIPIF